MHQNEQTDEAETPGEGRGEDGLLSMLTEAARELEAVRGQHRGGGDATEGGLGEGMLSSAHGDDEEEECMRKVLGALRELSVSHSDRVAEWREAVGECARMLAECPPEGSVQQHPPTTG